jgi:alkylated DNA repair dioxygenase AlkB
VTEVSEGVKDPVNECRQAISQLEYVSRLSKKKLRWVEDPARYLGTALATLQEIQEFWAPKLKESVVRLIEEVLREVNPQSIGQRAALQL